MTTQELTQIDKDLIWHPFTPLINPFGHIPLKSAKGCKLITTDGEEIIDAVSSWWVNIHGHSNEVLAKAIYEQALEMEHTIFAGFTHEPAVKLAQNLMTILPKDFSKVFFSDNGSTAIEVALKMAFQYWHNKGAKNKNRVIAIHGAYHGDTFGAMSVGERGGFNDPFSSLLFDVDFIDLPTENNQREVLAQLKEFVQNENCAAFIFEPLVQGAGGMNMYSPNLLNQLLEVAKANDIISIADEVMTGFGRTGTTFATDQIELDPDIMCISKGITGGTMAQGITACHKKIEEAFQTEKMYKALLHGHSYTGNPLACAAANASFEIFNSDECRKNIKRVADQHTQFIDRLQKFDNIENIRQTGTIIAFDLIGYGEGYDSQARKNIYPYFLEKGVLIRPLGNVIYLLPPYTITNEELEKAYSSIESFLKTV